METTPVITTQGLSYRYSKGINTLSDIHLRVDRGSIYGFLGPNGSGKTTTLSLLLGLLNNQQGQIEIFGKDLANYRVAILKKVGSLVETPSLYGHLTARENLEVYRSLYGAERGRIEEVLIMAGLADTHNKTVRRFSLGMKQRLSIAIALLPNPELLILDEPSNGLDPKGIIELRALIKHLNKTYGMTILISSHLLSEVEKMVSHVGIIYKGRLLFQGSLQALQQLQQQRASLHIKTSDNAAACQLLEDYHPEDNGELITIAYQHLSQVAIINRTLANNGIDVYLLQPTAQDLEQLFINLTTDAI